MSLVLIHPAPDALWADVGLDGVPYRAVCVSPPVNRFGEGLQEKNGSLFPLPLKTGLEYSLPNSQDMRREERFP